MKSTSRKKSRKKRTAKNRQKRIPFFKYLLIVALMVISIPVGLFCYVYFEIPAPLPNKEALEQIENPEASIVYDIQNRQLGKYFIYERTTVPFENISSNVVQALIATEDARFYEHDGIDYRSLFRVLFKTILMGDKGAGGGSTISQQLAKNLFHRREFPFFSMAVNKIREMIIASRLEKIYSKEEIISIYLNTVPFGDNTFGIESASQHFYGTKCNSLSDDQAAVLVGMLKGNTLYNPRINPELALERRNVVLDLMLKEGFLTAQEKDIATSEKLALNISNQRSNDFASYFMDRLAIDVKEILEDKSDEKEQLNIYTSGLKIYTTLDRTLQFYAEKALKAHLEKLQKDFDAHWKNTKPWDKKREILNRAIHNSDEYKKWKNKGLSERQILDSMSVKKTMEVFSWQGTAEVNFSSIDSIKYYQMILQAGFIAVSPTDGQVKAWVGGIDHNFFQYDHVNVNTKRQVGSTFKPFVYATALDEGASPCSYYKASQATYVEDEQEWTPSNDDDEYEGKYSMEGALQNSVNTVSVKILEDVGVGEIIDRCRKMGIESDIPPYPSIALGTPSISLMEMAGAYGSLVNNGNSVHPYYLLKIEDEEGNIIWENEGYSSQRVFNSETSALMVEMMKGVVNEGTGARLRHTYHLPNDFAGKTGTTQNNADGWFIGMLPELVVAVWVGADNPSIHFRSTALGQGANTALPIFAKFYEQVNTDKKYNSISRSKFKPLPNNLEHKMDCDPFKEEFKFFDFLFGKRNKDKEARKKERAERKKEGFFKRLFGKNKKE